MDVVWDFLQRGGYWLTRAYGFRRAIWVRRRDILANLPARLFVAFLIVIGEAVMYNVDVLGPVELEPDRELHMVECKVKASRVVFEDG